MRVSIHREPTSFTGTVVELIYRMRENPLEEHHAIATHQTLDEFHEVIE